LVLNENQPDANLERTCFAITWVCLNNIPKKKKKKKKKKEERERQKLQSN
jgi:hypothetical protein